MEQKIILKEKIHNDEIKRDYNVLKYLKENNTACEKCGGEGNVIRHDEKLICNICKGSGKRGEKK